MNIRRATIEDLEAIVAIELENFSPEEAIDKTVLAKHIETFFHNSFLVAEKDGQTPRLSRRTQLLKSDMSMTALLQRK